MASGWRRSFFTAAWPIMMFCLWMQVAASQQQKPVAPQRQSTSRAAATAGPFYLHAAHAKVGLECSACHVPVKEGSVTLQRPGHDQCMACHADAFGENLNQKVCQHCHSAFPPTSSEDLLPYPRYKGQRAILKEFSHARHADPKGRVDAHTGFRSDCTFCHRFDAQGVFATSPAHAECASCHSRPGLKPQLSSSSSTDDCRACHNPEEIENPGSAARPRILASEVVSGKYAQNLRFSHLAHFQHREEYHMTCQTCHAGVMASTGLADLSLPKMVDCARCHEAEKSMGSQFRLANCQSCHLDKPTGPAPGSHTLWVRPASHTEIFRLHHEAEAAAREANCFVCHTNVLAQASMVAKAPVSSDSNLQCLSCHKVMRPLSHTARWRDDVHGRYAAVDRQSCATCHATDDCSRCHNELPRSHVPLPQFKAGAHARLAMLNERSCLTCHTFQDTCAQCHTTTLR